MLQYMGYTLNTHTTVCKILLLRDYFLNHITAGVLHGATTNIADRKTL